MKDVRAWAVSGLLAAGVVGWILSGVGGLFGQVPAGVTLLPPTAVDAEPVARPGMSLDQLIATVLTSDPRLRVGYEEINQAIASAITASLPPNPTLSPDYQLIPLTRPFTPTQQGGPPQFDALVAYPIDWFLFGKRKAAMASTAVGIRKTEAEYYDLVRQRIREAGLGFYDVLEFKALRDLAQQDVESLQKVEARIRRALEIGGKTEVDLSRIQLEVFKSQQLVREADNALSNAKARLRAIQGRTDGDAVFDVLGTLDLPPLPAPMSVDEAIAIAEANRPDLQALR